MKATEKIDRRLRSMKGAQTSQQIAEYLLISTTTVRRSLRELVDAGLVKRIWTHGIWKYRSTYLGSNDEAR